MHFCLAWGNALKNGMERQSSDGLELFVLELSKTNKPLSTDVFLRHCYMVGGGRLIVQSSELYSYYNFMSKTTKFLKNSGPISVILSVILSVLFVVNVVQAATTIGSNISTDGTVSVTGLSTLGNASSTAFSVFNNAYFGATATSSFSSTGALTLTNALTYGGVTLSNAVTGELAT